MTLDECLVSHKAEQAKILFNLHKELCDEFTILGLINKRLIGCPFF